MWDKQLQGRFSGRLARKEDEAQLVVECALLGPLLGDSQPATLSTIVRSIASGRVRKYLERHLPRGANAVRPQTTPHPPPPRLVVTQHLTKSSWQAIVRCCSCVFAQFDYHGHGLMWHLGSGRQRSVGRTVTQDATFGSLLHVAQANRRRCVSVQEQPAPRGSCVRRAAMRREVTMGVPTDLPVQQATGVASCQQRRAQSPLFPPLHPIAIRR